MKVKMKKKLATPRIIALGFALIIIVGTLLLMTPWATKEGTTSLLDALFTATSATCVTGLVVADTYTHWTLFGQLIILLMIQIGGLGFMTIGVIFSFLLRKNIGLRERGILQESLNAFQIGGVVKLTKKLVRRTVFFEGIGAMLLMLRFIPKFGLSKGIYFGIFHSISAFCNAGFDLMGIQEQYSSLCEYSSDAFVNIVVIALVTIGGIGFLVWDDVADKKLHFSRYRLHTKIVLITSTILLFGGAFIFFLLERGNLMAHMGVKETILTSLFSSMTARTAGFNTIDTGALTDTSKLFNVLLMFIGGSSGSTAGGVKTTTIAVIFIYVWSSWHGENHNNIWGRRLEDDVVKRACLICANNLVMALVVTLLIGATQAIPMMDILTETFSAIGTVGMTANLTRELSSFSRILIIFLMYCGRIGSVTFALFFMKKQKVPPVQMPVERILLG